MRQSMSAWLAAAITLLPITSALGRQANQSQSTNTQSTIVSDPSNPSTATVGLESAEHAIVPISDDPFVSLQTEAVHLREELATTQNAGAQDDKLKKQVELLQKQIETQQRMIQLLLEQVKKPGLAGAPVEKLQTQVATLEARSQQAARRDVEVSQAIDNLTEHMDAVERNGPRLPETLKELFLPSRTNETPFSVYGTLVGGYQLFVHQKGEGQFFFDALEPIFLLQLNDHILLESELEFGTSGVDVGYAQMDYIVNDWLTVVFGRYLGPVGFFNERLHPDWVNKMPDFPLMMRQVSLADFSLNGIQLRGAKYLCCSPFKLEYSIYAANGLATPGDGTLTDLADLGAIKETTGDVNDAMAFGSRVGFWLPEWGIAAGFSTFFNRPYSADAGPRMDLWDIDINYHKGNWDFRFEYADMVQKSPSPMDMTDTGAGDSAAPSDVAEILRIHRRGMYAQIAYQQYRATNFLRNTAFVFRYSRARFKGIDPNTLDLTAFESPVDVPVDRDQYTFGINYYFYPSLVVKFAYEINREHGIDLKDDMFLAQLAWGF
jgi:hypothetical protein